MSAPEAFLLLSLPNTTLTTFGINQYGVLGLECVTIALPEGLRPSVSTAADRDVYLVLRHNSFEAPIDPARVIQRTDGPNVRTYTFRATETEPNDLVVAIAFSHSFPQLLEDLETFEGILSQYADFRGPSTSYPSAPHTFAGQEDLRGHLVLINQDNGEVLGELDHKYRVREDPTLGQRGHEDDPVVIEIPVENLSGRDQDATTMEMFVRTIPPDQQDWITKSATVVSHAISLTTNLLITTITSASDYYISHSAPSPHHPGVAAAASGTRSPSGTPSEPPALPPRALVFLTSESTRRGLSGVHAVSGQAVKVSSKTVSLIDSMIRKAVGGKPKKGKTSTPSMPSPAPGSSGLNTPYLPPRAPSPLSIKSSLTPPPYSSTPSLTLGHPAPLLPPRRSPSPVPPLPPRAFTGTPEPSHYNTPIPPRTFTGPPEPISRTPNGPPGNYHGQPGPSYTSSPGTYSTPPESLAQGPAPRLSTKARIMLSADLILSTIDHSTRQLIDKGAATVGGVVAHKYGPDAGESAVHLAGTARNVALVYVDLSGIGRRAILKRAGKEFVKARLPGKKNE